MMWTEAKTRAVVKDRSGGVCERCDRARATDMHHRQNRSQGGRWNPANIVHLCAWCHHLITVHPEASRLAGWSVRSTDDPETVPVPIRGTSCLLELDGTIAVIPDRRLSELLGEPAPGDGHPTGDSIS